MKAYLITWACLLALSIIGTKIKQGSDYFVQAVHLGMFAWTGWLLFNIWSAS